MGIVACPAAARCRVALAFQPCHERLEQGRKPAELIAVGARYRQQHSFSGRGDLERYAPSIGGVGFPAYQSCANQTVGEPHGAVMLDHQLVREISDGWPALISLDGEQGAVLLGSNSGRSCRVLAKHKELPDHMAKV
jgi:hypothetical protein